MKTREVLPYVLVCVCVSVVAYAAVVYVYVSVCGRNPAGGLEGWMGMEVGGRLAPS